MKRIRIRLNFCFVFFSGIKKNNKKIKYAHVLCVALLLLYEPTQDRNGIQD